MQRRSDDLTPITFGQELLCGMAGCNAQTTTGLVERDLHHVGLWRLLPVCARCLSDMRTGGRIHERARGGRHQH